MSNVVLMMAGGTGGHVFPALAVAHELKAEGYEVHWLGTKAGIEADLVPANGFPLHTINIAGLRGKGKFGLALAPFRIVKAVWQALTIIRRVKPNAVMGLGGYAHWAGWRCCMVERYSIINTRAKCVCGNDESFITKNIDCCDASFSGRTSRCVSDR